MTFVSLEFLIFFPITVLVYFLSPFRVRWAVLLVASYIFYMAWNPPYIVLIIGTTAVTWIAALRVAGGRYRTAWFWVGILVNLGSLATFKYFNFFAGQIAGVFGSQAPQLHLLLPIAISFHSFQLVAYMIDVHRGRIEPERDWRVFALYGCFFPQLVAGPIERGAHFLPQLRRLFDPTRAAELAPDDQRIVSGLRLMLLGYFKKVVVADNFGPFVNLAFAYHSNYGTLHMWAASIAFAMQIYFDFSGYTDIARGTARVMGFDLLENFNHPYFATSLAEFWRRWHISLTSWFRDYIYFPMGGNRVSRPKWARNILVVFVLSGLWHGANWTFIAWGFIHGSSYIVEEEAKRRFSLRLPTPAAWFLTFVCVVVAWVFFRAPSIGDAVAIVGQMFVPANDAAGPFALTPGFIAAACGAAAVFTCEALSVRGVRVSAFPAIGRWTLYYAALVMMLLVGQFGSSPFIYFQF